MMTGGEGLHLRGADLPGWLKLDSYTGKVSGTPVPTTADSDTFSLIARDANGYQRKTFTIPLDRWGVNVLGWNITLDNRSDYVLSKSGYSRNIYYAPASIGPEKVETGIRGTMSWWGGPANLTLIYETGVHDGIVGVVDLRLTSYADGRVEATCDGGWKVDCTINQAVAGAPIKITVTATN
jgi:hypothetical protein